MVSYSNIDIFNSRLPKRTPVPTNVVLSLHHRFNYRLEYFHKVLKEEEGIRELLHTAPLSYKYKNILIDLKTEVIEEEETPCTIKGWHLDGKKEVNTNKPSGSLYHIFITGGCPTEFLAEPLVSENYGILNQRVFAKYNLDNTSHNIYKLPLNCWNTYTENDWHRGAVADTKTVRTFIRVVESDYIKPQGKKWDIQNS